jgi:V8-like Glu-specific endopeptidase
MKRHLIILLAAPALLVAAQAAMAAPAAPPTEGARRPVSIRSSNGQSSFAFEHWRARPAQDGFAGELAEDRADDSYASIPAREETAEEVWKLVLREARTAPVGRESVIGRDDRVQQKKTTKYPSRAIGWLLFDYDGDTYSCTAWLISPDTIATAGHCVHDGFDSESGWSENPVFFPGRNGSASPYGSCNVINLYTNNVWYETGDEEFDWGAGKLDCNVGQSVGFFGYWWQTASLNKILATIQGYPGDKADGTQWYHAQKIKATSEFQVFYPADTFGGQSGSPIFTTKTSGPCRGTCAFGIHAYGLHGGSPHGNNNHGSRINEDVFDFFQEVIAD